MGAKATSTKPKGGDTKGKLANASGHKTMPCPNSGGMKGKK